MAQARLPLLEQFPNLARHAHQPPKRGTRGAVKPARTA
jgi:hypothetical protein